MSVVVGNGPVDPGREVVAVDTESRALAPLEAERRVRAAAERLRTRIHTGFLFKKIDSTLRGAVGWELRALQEASGRGTALVCPAFPEQGRTVVHGVLRVHGEPAHHSSVRRDPAYPGDTSDVREILRRGSARAVGYLPLDCVRAGRASIVERLAQVEGTIVAADAETDADLDALAAAAISSDVVVAGSAGLARAIAVRLGHDRLPIPLPAGRAWLIVAGSLHPATRAQISMLEAAGVPAAVADEGREPDIEALVARLRGGQPALLTTAEVPAAASDARPRMAALLARAAARVLAETRPDLVAVTGGDTARALIAALGADRLELTGSPSSGLALAELATNGGPALGLLTKAGGFGAPGLFLTLLKGAA